MPPAKWSTIVRAKYQGGIRAGNRLTFTARYERDGPKFWHIRILQIYASTQTERFEDIEMMARDLVATVLEVPEDSFDVLLEQAPDG